MSASKQNFAGPLVAISGLVMTSFLGLMAAIKGDNSLRMILAGVGFLGFAGLLTALLISRSKAKA